MKFGGKNYIYRQFLIEMSSSVLPCLTLKYVNKSFFIMNHEYILFEMEKVYLFQYFQLTHILKMYLIDKVVVKVQVHLKLNL